MRQRLFTLLVLVSAATGSAIAQPEGDTWRFRGQEGKGFSNATGLPTTWSDDKNIEWRFEMPGAGSSSPLVVGDRIYITCYSGYGIPGQPIGEMENLERRLVCLSLADGAKIWEVARPATLPETKYANFVDTHGYASSTPVTDGKTIYCFWGTSGVFAFSMDGKPLWQAEVGSRRSGWGTSASPILWNNLLIVNASIESQRLLAFDKTSGELVWQYEKVRDAWNTPTLVTLSDGTTQCVLNDRVDLVSVDARTGKPLWQFPVGTSFFCSSAIAEGTTLFVMPKNSPALAVAVEKEVVTPADLLWKTVGNADISSPVLHDGHLYWASNLLYRADAKTGEIVQRTRIPGGDKVFSSLLAADGKLYVNTRLKGTFVYRLDPSLELLSHNVLNKENSEDVVQSSMVTAGKSLLLRSNQYLWKLTDDSAKQ